MKQILLNFRFLSIFALMAFAANVSAEDFSYSFSSSIPEGWTSSVTPNGYEATSTGRGSQFAASSTLTLKNVKNAKKVVVTCSTNVADKNTIDVTIGGKAFGSKVTLAKENNVEKTFSADAASGDLAINITRAEKSVYILKVVVTADAVGDGGSTGGETGGDATLDPNYTYDEPTILKPTAGTESFNTAYSFIQNNVQVSATAGARTADYFGCNAGASITFTATKAIKGIVVNGYVKKDFEAEASCGDLYYVDASEDAVENDPVLAILDVDSTTVTISCDKQMRCYSVELYFEANPDLGLDDDDDDDEGDYNFDYEPNEVKSLDITFSEIDAADYSEYFGYSYVDVLLGNDDYQMELAVFAPYAEGTILAPGTYPINDSYEEGTVQASPGGDDYYDYPSFICTGFEKQDDSFVYTVAYYLVSGNLTVSQEGNTYKFQIDATTAKGSTVKAVYVGEVSADGILTLKKDTGAKEGKMLRHGRVVIVKKDKTYDAEGKRVE